MAGFHILDPLTAEEISSAAAACKAHAAEQGVSSLRFNTITLKEPAKRDLLAYDANPGPETAPPREAFCILQSPELNGAIEAVVAMKTGAVAAWAMREGVQPLASPDDCFDAEAIVKADPEVGMHACTALR
eukprot:TRINITY_DN15646_c0_g2_i1.p3 TRINITY_DN15646_c0_g2~~TRINITY_DN15646_c0_g2_i1.p3  ORF type:complete len:131 (-),score=40.61 TRINITY_DN15646_c0_g2_i1:1223-1615(-)